MSTIYDQKELPVTDTPLLLFQCVLQTGRRSTGARTG